MAGVGIKLNRIFSHNTIATNLYGFGYSIVITIAPMLIVILALFFMMQLLGFSTVEYAARELYACTILYIFIFSLMAASPFNAVLSKYMSDIIFEEKYGDIMPCFYLGLLFNLILSCLLGVPFCTWEYLVGHVDLFYVFTGFCGYISLVFVFYTTLYMSICKDYNKISLFYAIGMLGSVIISFLLVYVFSMEITYSIILSLTIGFLLIASMEIAVVKSYFKENSNSYRRLLHYFRVNWTLVVTNTFYIVGLFVHNFVFWTTDIRNVVADSFVYAESYDMASCLAMFTNISASVIFLARVEMHFHERYRAYSEAVIGGRWADIEKAKKRMFQMLADELMDLARLQFIVSVVVYLAFIIILPQFGFSGMIMRIYPCLAAAYFVLFLMYAAIIFLYYFDDVRGALLTTFCFFSITLAASIKASELSDIWYGMGLFAGAFTAWGIAYYRLRWIEKNIDNHIFCKGELLKKGRGKKPPELVYNAYVLRKKFRFFKGRRKIA
jgi:polysaccharide biosynthesis protein PelG